MQVSGIKFLPSFEPQKLPMYIDLCLNYKSAIGVTNHCVYTLLCAY